MRRRTNDNQPVAPENRGRDSPPRGRIGHEADIRAVLLHRRVDLRRPPVIHAHIHQRKFPAESFEVGRQLVKSDTENRGNAQLSGNNFLQLLHPRSQFVVGPDNFPARRQESLPLRREAQCPAPAVDQTDLELILNRANLLADRALCDTIAFCGFGKAFRIRQIAEYFKCLNLHPTPP